MFGRLVVSVKVVEMVGIAKKIQYFSHVFTGLIATAQSDILPRRCILDDELFGVSSPVEQCAVKEEGISARALTSVGRPAKSMSVRHVSVNCSPVCM